MTADPLTPDEIASTIYAFADLDAGGVGDPNTVNAALVIAEAHGLPRPVLDYLNAVRKILLLGTIPPRLYEHVATDTVNPLTGKVSRAVYAPRAPDGAKVIRQTRALLFERLDTLKAAAYKALPRPPDPLK
jgi:hypothetical protein